MTLYRQHIVSPIVSTKGLKLLLSWNSEIHAHYKYLVPRRLHLGSICCFSGIIVCLVFDFPVSMAIMIVMTKLSHNLTFGIVIQKTDTRMLNLIDCC